MEHRGSGSPHKDTKWPVMGSGALGLDQRSEAAAEPGDPRWTFVPHLRVCPLCREPPVALHNPTALGSCGC